MSADLEARVSTLEHLVAAYRSELQGQIVDAANKLRTDDNFMKPAAQKFTDHAGDHLFDKVARRLLMLLLGIFGSAGLGVAIWLGSKGFK